MLSLLQLLLPKRAAKQRVAVLIHPVGEVLTSHADASAFPALKLCVVDKGPFLHCFHGMPVSTSVLLLVSRRRQRGQMRTILRTETSTKTPQPSVELQFSPIY